MREHIQIHKLGALLIFWKIKGF